MNTVLLLIFTIFSLVSFIVILWGADPYSANSLVRTLFFVTLFFSFVGAFSLLGLWVSRLFSKPLSFDTAFRRGFLLASLAISLVLLETFSVLNIGNAFAAFLIVVSMEMLAVYKKI